MDVVVGLGSNVGSREGFLRAAVRLLRSHVDVIAVSSVFMTPPLGPPQPDFLNAAVRVRTELAPRALLERTQRVELALGRVREVRWGPRTIDLDLLWCDGGEIDEPGLRVPHPGLVDRAFALAPLLEVAPELERELGPRLAELGAPPKRAWTAVDRREGRFEARALDDLDALALALSAALGDPDAPSEVESLEHADAEELVARASRMRHPATVALEPAESGAIRARMAYDPARERAETRLTPTFFAGGRCVLA